MLTWLSRLLVRLSLSASLGAGLMFVTVALKPMRSPELDSLTKAHLAVTLFPGYYCYLFIGLGSAWLASFGQLRTKSGIGLCLVTTLGLGLAVIDYLWIYAPLAEMTRAVWVENAPHPAYFQTYHYASRVINGAVLLLTAIGAITACGSNSTTNEKATSTIPPLKEG